MKSGFAILVAAVALTDTRIRDVHEGPDGALYVMTDRDEGKILRLVPK